jgi:hypothetical protein
MVIYYLKIYCVTYDVIYRGSLCDIIAQDIQCNVMDFVYL